jgi:hypothetical protein
MCDYLRQRSKKNISVTVKNKKSDAKTKKNSARNKLSFKDKYELENLP